MNPIKYCLPIIANSKSTVAALLKATAYNFDYIEIWLSSIADIDIPFVSSVIDDYPGKIILLFRHPPFLPSSLSVMFQREVLNLIANKKVFIDYDINLQKTELEEFSKPHTYQLITSSHYYDETPEDSQLKAVLQTMSKYKPVITKIAAFCNTPEDCVRLLSLGLNCKEQGLRSIVLGMGEYGTATRVFGTLWGNELVYAPLIAEAASAPGQLTRMELEQIFKVIGYAR
jgi:3-dehydroquinate dehydratase